MRNTPGKGLDPSAPPPSHPAPAGPAAQEAGPPGAAGSPRQSPLVATALAAARDNAAWLQELPSVPVFSPTAEEWADPIAYIDSIAAEAAPCGACVVRAPLAPAAPAAALLKDLRFSTRLQSLRDAAWGPSWDEGAKFWETGRQSSLGEFARAADEFARRRLGLPAAPAPATAEALYWRERAGKGPACVEYGSDVEGSGFGDGAADGLDASAWSLRALPRAPGSALRWCAAALPGVATPMLYIAQLYSTFAWHVEDHFLLAANYLHAGAPKVWYCVPAAGAEALEAAAGATVYAAATEAMQRAGAGAGERAAAVAAALARKTTMFSPQALRGRGVPVFRAVQHPGSFVITFPRCYHAGFATGFSIAEAVNLSTPGWWPAGELARRMYRSVRPPRPQVLPHSQCLCDEARALGQRLVGGGHGEGTESPRLGGDWPAAAAFVAEMQAAQLARDEAWSAGATAVDACPPGLPPEAPEARAAVPCPDCGDLSFLASVVLDGAAPQEGWRHLCLACAAADGAAACTRRTLMFVKPCWRELVGLAARLQPLVEAEAAAGAAAMVAAAAGGVPPAVAPAFHWCNFEEPATELPAWALGRALPPPAERVQKPSPEPEPAPPPPPPAMQEAPEAEEDEQTADEGAEEAGLTSSGAEMEANGHGEGEEEEAKEAAGPRRRGRPPGSTLRHEAELAAASALQETGPLARTRGKRVREPSAKAQPDVADSDDNGDGEDGPSPGGRTPRRSRPSSPSPAVQPARFLFHDAVAIPGKAQPFPRRVIQIVATGERVLLGGDVVRACVPDWEKNLSLTRWLTRKLRAAAGLTRGGAGDVAAHLAFVPYDKQERAVALRESGAALLLEGMARRGDPLHAPLAALFEGLWDGAAEAAAAPAGGGSDDPAVGRPKRPRVAASGSASPAPAPPPSPAADLPAFLRAISPLAAAEALCASLTLRDPANPAAHSYLPEAPGSGGGLKRYVLPETGEVAVSAYHVITPVIKGSFACSQVLSSWTRAVARSPRATAAHVVAMAPLFYRCEGFKSHSGATFLLTLEQCAVVREFSLATKRAPPEGRATLRALMVAAWGEAAVAAAEAAVAGDAFLPTTPLRAEVRRALAAALREETCGRKLPAQRVRTGGRRARAARPAAKEAAPGAAPSGRPRGRPRANRPPSPEDYGYDDEEEGEEGEEGEGAAAAAAPFMAPIHEFDEAEARFTAMLAAVHSKELPAVPDHIAAALEQLSSEPVLKLDDPMPPPAVAGPAAAQAFGQAYHAAGYGQQGAHGFYAAGSGLGAFQPPPPPGAPPAADPIATLLAALQGGAGGGGGGWGNAPPAPAVSPSAAAANPALAAMQSVLSGFAAVAQQPVSPSQDAINQQLMSLLYGAGGGGGGGGAAAPGGAGNLPQQYWR